jgi:CMP-N-acetylneuraminic acid synthetase
VSATLAVIPARGGSKGLPGKNIRPLAGLPLIEHSIRLAALCPEIDRTVVSTDSQEIANAARSAGAEVVDRPSSLAQDDTPMLPVLQHALDVAGQESYTRLLLLDPTSPARLPEDVERAHALLAANDAADGVVSVSEPGFNPIWHAVVEREGYLEQLFPEGRRFGRRQDVPRVLRIAATLYLFRVSFLQTERETWLAGRHLPLEIPDLRALHIDGPDDFVAAEALIRCGAVSLPWLDSVVE